MFVASAVILAREHAAQKRPKLRAESSQQSRNDCREVRRPKRLGRPPGSAVTQRINR
jgi:hypothetical protein